MIWEKKRQHLKLRSMHNTYQAANNALHQLLLWAILLIYLEAIKGDALGFFGRCTALQIIDQLWEIYGVVNDNQLAENLEKIIGTPLNPYRCPFHPAQDILSYFGPWLRHDN